MDDREWLAQDACQLLSVDEGHRSQVPLGLYVLLFRTHALPMSMFATRGQATAYSPPGRRTICLASDHSDSPFGLTARTLMEYSA